MDIVAVPTGGSLAHPRILVPYLCNERYSYDGQGLFDYPERVGIDWQASLVNGTILEENLAPFVQAWLWFGQVSAVASILFGDHTTQDDAWCSKFVTGSRKGQQVVTAGPVHDLLARAAADTKSATDDGPRLARYDACVRKAAEAVEAILSRPGIVEYLKRIRNIEQLPSSFIVLLSVQLLIERLWAARRVLFPDRLRSSLTGSLTSPFSTSLVNALLQRAGRSEQDIRDFPLSVSMRYYISFLQPAQPSSALHARRTESVEPVHIRHYCQCEDVSIRNEYIDSIAEHGEMALFTFDPGAVHDKLSITPMRIRDRESILPPFVAISHARASGLGNARAHCLPACQLSFIQDQAQASIIGTPKLIPFWIDTMCLPLRRSTRKKVLPLVRSIYSHATKVLVIEPSLTNSVRGTPQECLVRIRYSLWKRRLWTLQEGALARDLRFVFGNSVLSLSSLIQQHEQAIGSWKLLSNIPEDVSIDVVDLARRLARFDDDIKATRHHDEDRDRKLRSWLRLGYLAFPKFRYLAEEHESVGSALLLEVVQRIYGSYSHDQLSVASTLEQQLDRVTQMKRLLSPDEGAREPK